MEQIDIEKVIASKNPKLLKMIPGFILTYLKRTIHQEEINKALREYSDQYGLEFVDNILKVFGADIRVHGIENIEKDKRYIIASNHPLGGLDGMALMQAVGRVRKDIVFPVNDLLMFLPQLRELFIPINKHGTNAQNLQLIDDTFASDKTVLYFPAGLCSRKQKGRILDLEWKKSFISKAKKHHRDIIPTYIDGENSRFFYRLANIRKSLGMKANIEMLYLPDEMFSQKGKIVNITFGKPISFNIFTTKYTDKEWAGRVKDHVYALAEGVDKFEEI